MSVDFAPDGKRVVVGDHKGYLEVFDVAGGMLHQRQAHQHKEVKSVSWRRGPGDRIASCGQDGRIVVIDAKTYELALEIDAHPNEMYRIAWSPDGQSIAGTGWGNALRLWRGAEDSEKEKVSFAAAPPASAAERAAAACLLRLWSGVNPRPTQSQLAAASEALDHALKDSPANAFLRATRGLLDEALGREEQALARISEAIEAIGKTAGNLPAGSRHRLLNARARLYRNLGAYDDAAADKVSARAYPPRSEGTPDECLDLTPFYNARLDEDLFDTPFNSLSDIVSGGRWLTDTPYDVRGMVLLSATLPRVRSYLARPSAWRPGADRPDSGESPLQRDQILARDGRAVGAGGYRSRAVRYPSRGPGRTRTGSMDLCRPARRGRPGRSATRRRESVGLVVSGGPGPSVNRCLGGDQPPRQRPSFERIRVGVHMDEPEAGARRAIDRLCLSEHRIVTLPRRGYRNSPACLARVR